MNPSHNTLCHDVGHDWKSSLSQTYRLCQRKGCHLAQRLVNDTWQQITFSQRRELPEPEQALLWEEQTLLAQGLHPRQREIERQAELRYFQWFSR